MKTGKNWSWQTHLGIKRATETTWTYQTRCAASVWENNLRWWTPETINCAGKLLFRGDNKWWWPCPCFYHRTRTYIHMEQPPNASGGREGANFFNLPFLSSELPESIGAAVLHPADALFVAARAERRQKHARGILIVILINYHRVRTPISLLLREWSCALKSACRRSGGVFGWKMRTLLHPHQCLQSAESAPLFVIPSCSDQSFSLAVLSFLINNQLGATELQIIGRFWTLFLVLLLPLLLTFVSGGCCALCWVRFTEKSN